MNYIKVDCLVCFKIFMFIEIFCDFCVFKINVYFFYVRFFFWYIDDYFE